MAEYWDELIAVMIVLLLGAMSPGPDLAVVFRHTLGGSRKTGIYTALGITTGFICQFTFCLVGAGTLIQQSPKVFLGVKVIGSTYLAYLGYKGLLAKARGPSMDKSDNIKDASQENASVTRAYLDGFITNASNPKCTLFLLSLLTVLVDPGTPLWVHCVYGLAGIAITGIWFIFLAYVLTTDHLQRRLLSVQHWIQRILGFVLIGLAFSLLFS